MLKNPAFSKASRAKMLLRFFIGTPPEELVFGFPSVPAGNNLDPWSTLPYLIKKHKLPHYGKSNVRLLQP
jgi:hypothetical protein